MERRRHQHACDGRVSGRIAGRDAEEQAPQRPPCCERRCPPETGRNLGCPCSRSPPLAGSITLTGAGPRTSAPARRRKPSASKTTHFEGLPQGPVLPGPEPSEVLDQEPPKAGRSVGSSIAAKGVRRARPAFRGRRPPMPGEGGRVPAGQVEAIQHEPVRPRTRWRSPRDFRRLHSHTPSVRGFSAVRRLGADMSAVSRAWQNGNQPVPVCIHRRSLRSTMAVDTRAGVCYLSSQPGALASRARGGRAEVVRDGQAGGTGAEGRHGRDPS